MIKRTKLLADSDIRITMIYFTITCFVQFILLKHTGFENPEAIVDTALTNFLLLLSVLSLKRIVSSFLSKNVLSLINFEIILAMTAIIVGGSTFLLYEIYPGSTVFSDFLVPYIQIKSVIIFLQLFVSLYQFWYSKNEKNLQLALVKKLEVERVLQQSELQRIEQTIQPHFLFNSLNSISALMIINPEEALRMLHLLSDYLRTMVRKEKENTAELQEEIAYLKLYLDIEKIRFQERLDVTFEIDPGTLEKQIPVFILQPLIENAVKYSLYGTDGISKIDLKTHLRDDQSVYIEICNPYDIETEKAYQGEGFGLQSVRHKMHLLYSRNDLLQIKRKNSTFCVSIIIPQS